MARFQGLKSHHSVLRHFDLEVLARATTPFYYCSMLSYGFLFVKWSKNVGPPLGGHILGTNHWLNVGEPAGENTITMTMFILYIAPIPSHY